MQSSGRDGRPRDFDLREHEIDVARIDLDRFSTNFALPPTEIDVVDIDRGRFSTNRRLAETEIDVARIDLDRFPTNFELPATEIDVADIDRRRFSTNRGLLETEIEVADIDRELESPERASEMREIDAGRVDRERLQVVASWIMQREHDDSSEVVPAVTTEAPVAVVVDPAALVRGLRLLAERIPGFTHLTPEEERSMIRASALDPAMIANGLTAAEVWEQSRLWTRMTPEELRELDATIREFEEVEKELTILLKGIAGANRKRRHRLGKAILALYNGLRLTVEDGTGQDNRLRPYFEDMRHAYMKNRKRGKGKDEGRKDDG